MEWYVDKTELPSDVFQFFINWFHVITVQWVGQYIVEKWAEFPIKSSCVHFLGMHNNRLSDILIDDLEGTLAEETVTFFTQHRDEYSAMLDWELEKAKREVSYQKKLDHQSLYELQIGATVAWLLEAWDQWWLILATQEWTKLSPENKNANKRDFEWDMLTIEEALRWVHAEKKQYLYNAFVWIDWSTGAIKTAVEKNDEFERYFVREKEERPLMLQDTDKDSANKLLPQNALTLITLWLTENVSSILTIEQFLMNRWNERFVFRNLSDIEKKELIETVMNTVSVPAWTKDAALMRKSSEILHDILEERRQNNYLSSYDENVFSEEVQQMLWEKMYDCVKYENTLWKAGGVVLHNYTRNRLKSPLDYKRKKGEQVQAIYTAIQAVTREIVDKHLWKDFEVPKKWFWRNSYDRQEYSGIINTLISDFSLDLDMTEIVAFADEYTNRWDESYILFTSLQRKLFAEDTVDDFYAMTEEIKQVDTWFVWTSKRIEAILSEHFEKSYRTWNGTLSPIFDEEKWLKDYHNMKTDEELIRICKVVAQREGFVFPAKEVLIHLQKCMDGYEDLKKVEKIAKDLEEEVPVQEDEIFELIQREYNSMQKWDVWFILERVNDLTEMHDTARKYWLEIKTSQYSPLEEYYIQRLRSPEIVHDRYRNEYAVDTHYWAPTWYAPADLRNIETLEKTLKQSWSKLLRSEVLSLDIRDHNEVLLENRFDLHETVPIKVWIPRVETLCYGTINKKKQSEWYYMLAYDRVEHVMKLIYDDSVLHWEHLLERYDVENMVIMWWGYMTFYFENKIVEISDKIEYFQHEPRLLTITAIKNAFTKIGEDRTIYLWWNWFMERDDLYY